MKLRVLFVDDDHCVLSGLKRSLRHLRSKWHMGFVDGGEQALAALEREPFDVLVTDMRMPRMSGAQLLERVRDRHEGVVRIVLSGYASEEHVARAVRAAHQFLNKPCDAAELERTVERSVAIRRDLRDPSLLRVVGKIDQLPAVPRLYESVVSELARPSSTAASVASIIEEDPAMSAKVLQMVSSAFFVSAVPTHTVQAAVARLGFDAIRNLVLAIEVFQAHSGRIGAKALERHQTHSLEVARLAASCFDDRKQAARAFTAGMLHDIGELIMAAAMPNTWRRLRNEAPTEAARYDLEQQLTRSTHAQLGAYLLGLWGVYDDVVGAVAHHHRPSAEASINPLTVAVHLAETFAQCRTADRTMAALDPGLADDERARELVGSMIHKMTHLLEAA